jgi:exopolysaccharide biosynthesis polyprenyl glycosylphosphotransferase
METASITPDIARPAPAELRAVPVRRGARDVALRRMLGAGDAAGVLLALIVALVVPADPATGHHLIWGVAAVPLMIVMFKVYGLYDRDGKRISYSTADDLPLLFHATVVGGLLLWLYSRISPLQRLDLAEILLFGAGVIVLVTAIRSLLRGLAGRLIGRERALLVGGGAMARRLVGKVAAHPEYRLDVIGSLAPGGRGQSGDHAEVATFGTVDDLAKVAAQHDVTRIVFSSRQVDEHELEQLLRRCRELSLKVSVLPALADVLGPAVEIDDVEGVTLLGVNPPWLPRSSRAMKRAMDLAIVAPVLPLLAPVLLAAGITIKLNSRGPVFFAQERVGRSGRRFRLYKFRTMVADAEERRAELLHASTDPNWLKLDHDPRITRVGRWLRRLSLDELPQLWNVLRGEMSLVGPRPLIPAEDERVQARARGVNLTPGITGYWQVLGRTRIPFEEMVKLDYLYVMNWSLWEDVRLMLRTLPVVLGGRGAN